MKTSCGKCLNLAHYFPYDVKLRLLALSKVSAPTIAFLAFSLAKNSDYEPLLKTGSLDNAIDLFTDTAAILNSEEIMGCPGGR